MHIPYIIAKVRVMLNIKCNYIIYITFRMCMLVYHVSSGKAPAPKLITKLIYHW